MTLSKRAARVLRGLVVGAAISAVPAAALAGGPPPDTAQAKRIVAAFKDWAARWNVPNGSIAVMNGTTLTGTGGFGSYTAGKTEPVASESKAITAVCITKLVEAGRLSFNEPLGKVLKSYFSRNPPLDVRIKSITIAELLTHSSGMTADPSQGNQGGEIEQLPHNKTNLAKQVGIVWANSLGNTPGTTYTYNNMNYAVLGFIIERLTGEKYENYCGATVLQPVGITDAKLNPDWRVMASWGGWKISPKDYVRFLEYYLPSMHLLSIAPAQWPQFDLGDGAYYSLGTAMRQAGNGYNFWHDGSWQWDSDSFGGFFTVIQENVRYMADYAPTVSDDAVSDLDSSLYAAATAGAAPPGFDKTQGTARHRTDLLPK